MVRAGNSEQSCRSAAFTASQPSFLQEASHMRGVRLLKLTVLLALLLGLPLLAQAPTGNVLTNADIVKMMKAGLPESIILREIQMSRTDFATSPSALRSEEHTSELQ